MTDKRRRILWESLIQDHESYTALKQSFTGNYQSQFIGVDTPEDLERVRIIHGHYELSYNKDELLALLNPKSDALYGKTLEKFFS